MIRGGTYSIAGCRRKKRPAPTRTEEATWIHGMLRVAVLVAFEPDDRDALHVHVTVDGAQLCAMSGERFAPAHTHIIERWIGCDCYRYLVVQLNGNPPYEIHPETGHLVCQAVLKDVRKGNTQW